MRQKQNKENRGFASMPKEKVKEIARKGGLAISQDKNYMKMIGFRGGKASGAKRQRVSDMLDNVKKGSY